MMARVAPAKLAVVLAALFNLPRFVSTSLFVMGFTLTIQHGPRYHRRHLGCFTIPTMAVEGPTPRNIVVVGGGIGGLSSAFDARHQMRSVDEITVVSDRESFQFTPSNPWVAVRKRTAEDISLPLKTILPRHGINFVHGRAAHLNPTRRQLKLENGTLLEYDFLVVATGPRLAFDEIPGACPTGDGGGRSESICVTPHASRAAEALDRLVSDPGPAVVGATQGASCFGPAYEYAFLLHNELCKRGGRELADKCNITFVTPEPYIGHIGLKGAGDSREILTNLLNDKGIRFITNCRVKQVGLDSVSVQYEEDAAEKGRFTRVATLPSKLTMLIPPFRGHKVWASVPGLTNSKGLLLVNEHQQSIKYPEIFGVGVCVDIPPVEETHVPTGAPKTGYMIESMGTAAILNIRSIIDFEEGRHQQEGGADKVNVDDVEDGPPPKLPHRALLNGLCLTDFGDDGAIFLTMPQLPPRRMDITIHGKVATLAKIAFEKYFLHKIETGDTDPYYEKHMLHLIGVDRTTVEDS